METFEAIGEWLVSIINRLAALLGIPVITCARLVVLTVVGFLLLYVVNKFLISIERRRYRKEPEALPQKMKIIEAAEFPNNGLMALLRYPVIFRLLDSEVKEEEGGETLGYIIQQSPDKESFLFFEGKWSRLSTIQTLSHLLIEQIEKQIENGVKISKEEKTPPGHFEWNGTIWKIERTLPFAVRVEKGDVFSFPGGEGAIELIVAIPYREEERKNGAVVLEKQFNPLRRRINETWTGYYVFEITEEEVKTETGELFETLDLLN